MQRDQDVKVRRWGDATLGIVMTVMMTVVIASLFAA